MTWHQLCMASETGFVWTSGCRAWPALAGCCCAQAAAGVLRPRRFVARELDPHWHIGWFPGVSVLDVVETSQSARVRNSCSLHFIREVKPEIKWLLTVLMTLFTFSFSSLPTSFLSLLCKSILGTVVEACRYIVLIRSHALLPTVVVQYWLLWVWWCSVCLHKTPGITCITSETLFLCQNVMNWWILIGEWI